MTLTNRYHIGYDIEDFSKILTLVSELLFTKFCNKAGNVCFNICSQEFCKVIMKQYGPGYDLKTTSADEDLTQRTE